MRSVRVAFMLWRDRRDYRRCNAARPLAHETAQEPACRRRWFSDGWVRRCTLGASHVATGRWHWDQRAGCTRLVSDDGRPSGSVVSTAAEFESLPNSTIVVDKNKLDYRKRDGLWRMGGSSPVFKFTDRQMANNGRATVIWLPRLREREIKR